MKKCHIIQVDTANYINVGRSAVIDPRGSGGKCL